MKALIVGLGSIGQRHLANLRQMLPDAEITVLRHDQKRPTPDAAAKLANRVVFHMDDALASAPDCAFIASPAPFHVDAARTLAERGIHLFLEKPISDRLTGVQELIELCRQRRLVLAVGYNLRHSPCLQSLHAAIQEGHIGRVLGFRAEVGQYLPDWRPTADYRNSVTARSELGGGVLLELSHEIHYTRWLLGEVASVCAQVVRVSDLEINTEDLAEIIICFASGAVGTIHLDMVQATPTRTCRVLGTDGTMVCDLTANQVDLYSRRTGQWVNLAGQIRNPGNVSYLEEMQDFFNCINTGSTPKVTGDDGLKTLEIVLAARASAAQQHAVSLHP